MIKRRLAAVPPDELHGPRWWVIRHTPTVLIDYLFEVLLSCIVFLSGLSFVSGFATSAIVRLLPEMIVGIFGGAFMAGGATALLGLWRHRYGTVLAASLRLLAFTCLAYAVFVIGFVGLREAVFTALMAVMLAAVAGWRAFLLRSTYLLIAQEAGARGPA